MQFELTQDFPVGLERLWHALGRADYVEQKYRSLGSSSIRILKFSADAQSIEVELERQAPVAQEELPVWARVLAGKQQAMHHHTRWRRAGADRVEVEIDIWTFGRLLGAKGIGSVVEDSPAHSCMTLHFDVTSKTPALTSSVAELFARQIKHALEADHTFTLDYLSAHRR